MHGALESVWTDRYLLIKVLDEDQKARLIISWGGTPLTQASEAACLRRSCPLGNELGQALRTVLTKSLETLALDSPRPEDGWRKSLSSCAEPADLRM